MQSSIMRRWSPMLAALLVLTSGVACKQKSSSKSPGSRPPQTTTQQPTDKTNNTDKTANNNPDTNGTSSGQWNDPTGNGPATTAIMSIAPVSMDALRVAANAPATVAFTLRNVGTRDVIIGLSEAPMGVKLTRMGDTVTMTWPQPIKGTYALRFILRDRAACARYELNAASCEIAEADYGRIGARSYDVVSDRYTLDVSDTGFGGGASNNQLINQIASILGTNNQGTLQGMNNGQLQQILGLAQNGFKLSSIMQILGL